MHSATVKVHASRKGEGEPARIKHVFEALKDVADSRATKRLIKDAHAAGVKAHIILPMVGDDCQVDARQLGRAFRQVISACVEGPGDEKEFGIGFSFAKPQELTILGAPLEEIAPTLVGKMPS